MADISPASSKFSQTSSPAKTMLADKRIHAVFALALILPSLGCATIVSGPRSEVAFRCEQPNAWVVIRDRKGQEVASTQSPAEVKLDRSVNWFKPAHYTATIEAPGYQPKRVDLEYTLNPWAFGNLIVGGIPGLIVDDASGALWMPKRTMIAVSLKSEIASNQTPPDGRNAVAHNQTNRNDRAVRPAAYQTTQQQAQ